MSTTRFADRSFGEVYEHLLSLPPPLLPPGKSTDPKFTDKISSLYVHPALEAALHILNADLPSAHFLCRHMQAPPQYEAMYLHGILHRIEGDFDNARAWYDNVADSDVFKACWSSKEDGQDFIDRVQRLKEKKGGDKEAMKQESLKEIKGVIDFCKDKYGTEKMSNASTEWKQPEDEEHRQMGKDMVSGSKGFRNF